MGLQERKEREKVERRAMILRCTKDLLLEKGSENVNMLDIAKKAELSKGTIYLYFSGKDDIFREICAEAEQKFIKLFQSRMEPGLSALEMIKLYWLCYIDMFGESDDMIIIFNMKEYIAPAFPFNPFEEQKQNMPYFFYTSIKEMIDQGIREGIFDSSINSGSIARTMLSLFSHIVENAAKVKKEAQKSKIIIEEVKHIFEILLRGIASDTFDRSNMLLPGLQQD